MDEYSALIIGHILGDGGINSKGRVYYCNTEDFLIEEFVNSMSKQFNVNPWIKKEKNINRVIYPVKVGRELWNLFGKFSFGKDTKIITNEINNLPLSFKVIILRAWFNDDGSVVNISKNYKAVAIHQKLKNLIIFIHNTLNDLGIKSRIMEDDKKWLLRITGYKDILKFKEEINFSAGYRKREQLNNMLESIIHPHFVTKMDILNFLQSPKTLKEICEFLEMDRHVIYGHLHGWKRKNRKSSLGLLENGFVKLNKRGRLNIYSLSSGTVTNGAQCG